jgi:hypothetical protein
MYAVTKRYDGFNMSRIKMAKRGVGINDTASDHTPLHFLEVTVKSDALHHVV